VLEAGGGADPEVLAVHLHAAGELERAREYAAQAARAAADALAFDRAARLYRFALELVPAGSEARRGLVIALATALANAGRGAESAAQYLAAADAAEGPREALQFRRCAAEQYLMSGHVSQGMAALLVVRR